MTKGVAKDEMGKVLSAIALMQALMPTIGLTLMRELYNATVDNFPGAFYLAASAMRFVSVIMCSYVWTRRGNFFFDSKGRRINMDENNPKTINSENEEGTIAQTVATISK